MEMAGPDQQRGNQDGAGAEQVLHDWLSQQEVLEDTLDLLS